MTDAGLITSILETVVALKDKPILLFALIVVLVLCLLLFVTSRLLKRAVRRFRDEMRRRIDECEDAHLERDKIQIASIKLIADLVADLRNGGVNVVSYELRSQQMVHDIQRLNDTMLERRRIERREIEEGVEE